MATNKSDTKKNDDSEGTTSTQEDLNTMTYGEWGWSALGEDENTEYSPSSPTHPNVITEDSGKNKITRVPSRSLKNTTDHKTGKPNVGISSSPSFQELEKAIKEMGMASEDSHGSLNSLSPNSSFLNPTHNKSSTDLTQQKMNQHRFRQQHRQHPSNSNFQSRNNNQPSQFNNFGTVVNHAIATPLVPARQELVNFVNESESRAIILFHSTQTSPVDIRNACSKFGVLYYIRPEFHSKGVTLISYFDLRSATSAHASICEELGPDANASAHYSVMLHAANSNSEEFRLVVRQLPRGRPESEVESIFSRYGQLRSIQKTYGDEEDKSNQAGTAGEGQSSAYSVEYHNIQDARLAVSELSATSAQIWGPGVSIKFAPLDDRKQNLCRQLLATLSRWRTEMSAKSTVNMQMSFSSPMNPMQPGSMGGPLVMNGSHSPISMSYHQMIPSQMPQYGVPNIPAMNYDMSHYAGNVPMFESNQQIVGGQKGNAGVNGNMVHHHQLPQNSNGFPQGSYGMMGMQSMQGMQMQNPTNMVPMQWNGSMFTHGIHQLNNPADQLTMQGKGNQSSYGNHQKYGQHQQSNGMGDMHTGHPAISDAVSTSSKDQYGAQRALADTKYNNSQSAAPRQQQQGPYNKGGVGSKNPPPAPVQPSGQQQQQLQQQQLQQQQQQQQQRQQQQMSPTYNQEQSFANAGVMGGNKIPHHHNGGHSAPNQFQLGVDPMMMPPPTNFHAAQHTKGGRGGKYNNQGSNLHNNSAGGGTGQGHKVNQIESGFALDLTRIGEDKEIRTTIMVRNIPNKYNQQMLLEEVNVSHEGTYDFFYLPIDFKNRCNVGYCFINFLEPKHIPPFVNEFNGQRWKSFNSEKICAVSFARIQGKSAMVSRFQNSSLLEKDDTYQPLLFYSCGPDVGKPEPFPSSARAQQHGNQHPTQSQHSLKTDSFPAPPGGAKGGAGASHLSSQSAGVVAASAVGGEEYSVMAPASSATTSATTDEEHVKG